MSNLSLKFLRGAQKAIRIGGFDAQILRKTDGPIDPNNPLDPPVQTETYTEVRVFVDTPKTRVTEEGTLVTIGDGILYVDLLSAAQNSETSVTWFPQDGDFLVYSDGRIQTLSDTLSPEANGQTVVTISTVVG